MSKYTLKAKHKVTGTIHDFTAIDNVYSYFYIAEEYNTTFTEKEFNELYEEVVDPNHPYGGLEVTEMDVFNKLDSIMPIKSGNDTWEDRFNKEFVDEDTGLLNIGKYDHERLLDFIKNDNTQT